MDAPDSRRLMTFSPSGCDVIVSIVSDLRHRICIGLLGPITIVWLRAKARHTTHEDDKKQINELVYDTE